MVRQSFDGPVHQNPGLGGSRMLATPGHEGRTRWREDVVPVR